MHGLLLSLNSHNCKECEEMKKGILPKDWTNNQMSLKHTSSLLEENIRLKQDKELLEKKLNDLLIMVGNKMDQMVSALNDIKNKDVVVNQIISSEKAEIKKIIKEIPERMFIPTPEPENLKSSIADIQKKTRKTDLNSSVIELSKLQDKSEK